MASSAGRTTLFAKATLPTGIDSAATAGQAPLMTAAIGVVYWVRSMILLASPKNHAPLQPSFVPARAGGGRWAASRECGCRLRRGAPQPRQQASRLDRGARGR